MGDPVGDLGRLGHLPKINQKLQPIVCGALSVRLTAVRD
jgi:hypothetical protein